MSDTQKTRAQILSLFADNVTGQISEQDLRDFTVTVMESEFANPGDFWAKPQAKYTTTDASARGQKIYSQYAGSDLAFGDICYQEASTGYWMLADATNSTKNGYLAMALGTYLSDNSTASLLIKGLVYQSSLSAAFSVVAGPIYLGSQTSAGEINYSGGATSQYIIGWITASDDFTASQIGKWYFEPQWQIVGQ
jgi:hypothetical protein